MEYILSPSILAADFSKLSEQITEIAENGAKYLHLDVMDGHFVPSISFGMPVIASIRKMTDLFFDVHLMIEEPDRYLEDFKKAGANLITVHRETCPHLDRTLNKIRELGLKSGLAINPATGIDDIDYVIDSLDMVLIMSVNPGFGGQKFIRYTLDKIKRLRERYSGLDIEVDGGIGLSNVAEVVQSGANVIVAGTAVFNGDVAENTRRLVERINEEGANNIWRK